ncbi:MAG: PAS domain S-box protein [Bacillota bacterium]|nr:PAS domain S-box protein [Bacillota bacterium]
MTETIAQLKQKIKEKEEVIAALKESEQSYHMLLANLPDLILIYKDWKIVYLNEAALKIIGYAPEEIIGTPILNHVVAKYHSQVIDNAIKRFNGEEVNEYEIETITRYQGIRTNIIRGTIVTLNGEPAGLVVLTDITDRKLAEKKLAESEGKYRNLVERANDGIAIIQDNVIKFANKSLANILGYAVSELEGTEFAQYIHSEEADKIKDRYQRRMNGEQIESIYETVLQHRSGLRLAAEFNAGLIPYEGREANLVIVRDITERKQVEEQLIYLSFHDKLTGLYNRAFFEEEIVRLDSERQLPLSVIIGDINGLKLVNDAFGHSQGDELLVEVAQVLKGACRQEDIICRWGGDEFAIILPKTNEHDVQKLCRRILQICEQAGANPVPVSISLGTATKNQRDKLMDHILIEAEDRMYQNKLKESNEAHKNILAVLQIKLIEQTDETVEHIDRMLILATGMGRKLGLSNSEQFELELLIRLHDIGKVGIPKEVFLGDLKDNKKLQLLKGHSEIGYRITKAIPEVAHIAEKVLAHHEMWDGTGYPKKLEGQEIPLLTRILAIIDYYDRICYSSSEREFSLGRQQAIEDLQKLSGEKFDPELVDIFLKLVKEDHLIS